MTDDPSIHTTGSDDLSQPLFMQMATIRRVEERLLQLFSEGLLNGTVHTCIGQEACAVGVVNALSKSQDIIFSNHRGHGHFLAYCDDVEGLIGELMGRSTGVCGGIGGSQHLHKDNFYSNGILGGIVPVATGMAFAEKRKRTGAIVTVFIGDGAFGEGVVYESLNIAALWKLPILFVVESNGYAQSTPTHLEHAGRLEARAEPFGIPVRRLEASDPRCVYDTAREMIGDVRGESRPGLLFLQTYRLSPHSKGDDTRDPSEIEEHRQRDPLALLREKLDPAWRESVEAQITDRVERAIAAAQQAPWAEL
jgi:TPP-dependent pyruvate/acetoin dehydrogenase alpha subunit